MATTRAFRLSMLFGLLVISSCGPKDRDLGSDGGPDAAPPPWGARISGKVWGPGHIFPVYGAMVAAFAEPPDALPEGAYCERCIAAPSGESSTLSGPDGSFTLQIAPSSTVYLVVQKGQFRKVTQYTAPGVIGDSTVADALTTLPNRDNAAAGATIPSIALVYGEYDAIQDVLAKVGIGDQDGAYGLAWGSEAGVFDVFDNHLVGGSGTAHGEALNNLLLDATRMSQYQLIVFACAANQNFSFMQDPTIQNNLRAYVRGGGKLYVSDYAYPVVEMAWPEFIWFTNPFGGCIENRSPVGCNHGPSFDSPSTSLDPGASAWLLAVDSTVTGAMPHAQFESLEHYDTIGGTYPGYVGDDSSGNPVSMAPKVWVEGPWNYAADDAPSGFDRTTPHPQTVSFPYGCGRVMYTTYHTVGTGTGRHPGLLTQELLLWQLVLELSLCSGDAIL